MYSDEEETVYERHYIDEEKARKDFVKRSAAIKSEMLNDIITLYDDVPEAGTPLPKQETPWDMTTKEQKKDKVASNPLQRYCNVDCDCNDFAEQSRNLNLTSTLSGAIFIPKIRKEQAYDY